MESSIRFMTALGEIIPGREIEIAIANIKREVIGTGTKTHNISAGGNLVGYPLGYEQNMIGQSFLKYAVALGRKSAIRFKGEIGLENATGILNSFCSKLFSGVKGISARALTCKDLNVTYKPKTYGLGKGEEQLLKWIERSESELLDPQEVALGIRGEYWLASKTSEIRAGALALGLACFESGTVRTEVLVDEKREPLEAEKQILVAVLLKITRLC